MNITVQPSTLSGTIHAPASKSCMQRACAAALVRKGKSVIHNPGMSNDDVAAISIIKNLGAIVEQNNESITINSQGINPIENEINCGESGLSIRMFTPIAALANTTLQINGRGSLVTRPMHFFDEILPQLNVSILSNQGKLPLFIKGPLVPQNITVDGSLSSQFLTGLLFAYGTSNLTNETTITVTNLKSKPYIDLSLSVMQAFHLNIPINHQYQSFTFKPLAVSNQPHATIHYTVEGDWSGASFLLVAGAIAGNLTVQGLDMNSTQADKAILQALIDCGCQISIQPQQIQISKASLKAFHFNATDCPDLFPPLVALAAHCNGISVVEGVSRLAHKESNRALTLQNEFAKMGVTIELQDDLMMITGANQLQAANVHSHHDHRIAMACAVAALTANGATTIHAANAIDKSYPNFFTHLQQLGVIIK